MCLELDAKVEEAQQSACGYFGGRAALDSLWTSARYLGGMTFSPTDYEDIRVLSFPPAKIIPPRTSDRSLAAFTFALDGIIRWKYLSTIARMFLHVFHFPFSSVALMS